MATGQDSGLLLPTIVQAEEQLVVDLWEAVRDDDVIKVRSLLEQGANPNHQLYWRKDWWNMYILPPVHEACKKGNLEIIKALVSGGADIKRGERDGSIFTPLHFACWSGRKDIVQWLVEECKCDVDVIDVDGPIPFDCTIQYGFHEVVDYLKSLQKPFTAAAQHQREKEETWKSKQCRDGVREEDLQPLSKPSQDKSRRSGESKDESSKSELALNEAMKAGFVRVKTTNILFFGMAGTGKTSTKHLLLGLPPPEEHNSTPLASTAERICIRQIRDTTKLKMEAQEDPSRIWRPVSSDDLQRIVADVMKSYVTNSDPNSKASAIPQELSIALKQLESSNESGTQVDATPLTSRASLTKLSVAGAKTSKFLNTVSNVMASIQRFSDDDRTALQEKFGSHWIYIIDSGGQPHFHNLLPLFMPRISVALYVLRLSDCLDDHPLVEYYKDNKPVGEGFKSHLSVLANFKYLVQSIQSHSENCKLVCIGTHKDHQFYCKERLSDKNKTLLNFMEKDITKNLTMFSNLGKKEIIFPVDCKHCDSDSEKVAKTIRECIQSQELNNNEILVPLWWFVLEIVVEKVSNDHNRKVLSKTECVEFAKAFQNFHEDALVEALKFFHEHHIFHYYPAILPNVVFCDTQVLLDKVTELVEHAAYVLGSNDPASGCGNWLDFINKGIITIEILSEKFFEKHYVDELFAPTDLIEIFKHLLIAAPFDLGQDKRFYMPSLLSLLPSTQVNEKRADLLKTGLNPLVLQFKSNWQCCGVFCCLQVYLIKECEWDIEIEDHQLSRNFVQFIHRKEDCFITLIDEFSFLEIHSSSDRKEMLSLISENIRSGLRSAYKALKYTYEDPEDAFLCPHKFPESSTETSHQIPHPACVLAQGTVMRCTKFKKMTYKLEDGHKNWLSARYKLEGIDVHEDDQGDENQLGTNNLQEILSELMDAINEWFNLGLALGIQDPTLKDIESNEKYNKDRLREMLAHWLQTSPSRTWRDICNGLRSNTVKHYVLADKIEKKYNNGDSSRPPAAIPLSLVRKERPLNTLSKFSPRNLGQRSNEGGK